MRSKATTGKKTAHRDIFPGHELLNINALYEGQDPIYSDEEEVRLFENTRGIRELITELEEKEAEIKTSESEAQ